MINIQELKEIFNEHQKNIQIHHQNMKIYFDEYIKNIQEENGKIFSEYVRQNFDEYIKNAVIKNESSVVFQFDQINTSINNFMHEALKSSAVKLLINDITKLGYVVVCDFSMDEHPFNIYDYDSICKCKNINEFKLINIYKNPVKGIFTVLWNFTNK